MRIRLKARSPTPHATFVPFRWTGPEALEARQIQAYQKILDRYDIPREEADAIIHHLDASEGSST